MFSLKKQTVQGKRIHIKREELIEGEGVLNLMDFKISALSSPTCTSLVSIICSA
jgi:hypothetical protein